MCLGERDKLIRSNGRGHFQQHCKERGTLGSAGERGALLGAGGGGDVWAERGMLLSASRPSHVRQGKDAVFGKQACFRAGSHFFRISSPLRVLPASPVREEPEAVGARRGRWSWDDLWLPGLGLHTLPCGPCCSWPGRTISPSSLSPTSVPSVQGALFAAQKDVEGMRGYVFKKKKSKHTQRNGRKDAVTCLQLNAGAFASLPPEMFGVTFITCSRARALRRGIYWGTWQ